MIGVSSQWFGLSYQRNTMSKQQKEKKIEKISLAFGLLPIDSDLLNFLEIMEDKINEIIERINEKL